jgi:hypothetical protein
MLQPSRARLDAKGQVCRSTTHHPRGSVCSGKHPPYQRFKHAEYGIHPEASQKRDARCRQRQSADQRHRRLASTSALARPARQSCRSGRCRRRQAARAPAEPRQAAGRAVRATRHAPSRNNQPSQTRSRQAMKIPREAHSSPSPATARRRSIHSRRRSVAGELPFHPRARIFFAGLGTETAECTV